MVDAIDKLMAFDVSLAADAYINSPFIPRMDSPQPEPPPTKTEGKKQNKASATNPFASAFFKVAEQNKKLRTAMKKKRLIILLPWHISRLLPVSMSLCNSMT